MHIPTLFKYLDFGQLLGRSVPDTSTDTCEVHLGKEVIVRLQPVVYLCNETTISLVLKKSTDHSTIATAPGGRAGTQTGPGAGGKFTGTGTSKTNGKPGVKHDGGNGIPNPDTSSTAITTGGGSGGGGGGYYGGGSGANGIVSFKTSSVIAAVMGGGGSNYVSSLVTHSKVSTTNEDPGYVIVTFS